MLYLGAQMELEAHLGHVSMVFEPHKSIGVEIKSIGESQTRAARSVPIGAFGKLRQFSSPDGVGSAQIGAFGSAATNERPTESVREEK